MQAAQAHPQWAALLAWCHDEQPGAARAQAWPAGPAGPDPSPTEVAQALALHLDGSLQLQACRGRAQQWALRLRTKLHDLNPRRPRQATDPWDAGWLRPGAPGLRALQRFSARRPTLLLAGAALGLAHQQQAEALLGTLQARTVHPLRLLCLRP